MKMNTWHALQLTSIVLFAGYMLLSSVRNVHCTVITGSVRAVFYRASFNYDFCSPQDIEDDKFLQEMMEDLAIEGIGWDDEAHRKGLPYPMRTADQLV